MTSNHTQSVVILGEDPAGLTAAYYLTRHGYRVTIVDRRPSFASPLIGGNLYNAPEPLTILGCHRATQALLHSLHPDSQQPEELAISLEFRLPDGSFVHYPRTSFPTPLHTWTNLLRFTGIPWKERWRLASWVEQLWEGDAQLPPDLEQRTADDWLASIGQSVQTRRVVWNPLALWLTGNDLSTMSADAFMRSIKPVFLGTRPDSRISVVQDSHHSSLLQSISDALKQGDVTMLHNAEAAQLRYERERISAVLLRDGSLLQADWYVAALPHEQLTSLLPEQWLTRYAYFHQLTELRSFDSAILHLKVEQPCYGPRLVLLGETPFHSVLVTAATPQHTCFSLVTTDSRFTQARPDSKLDVTITDLLRSWNLLTVEPGIGSISLRVMSNSILSLKPGAKLHRPIQRNPIANLLVGGAWTDTGWPPNLESAIVSGKLCADAIATG